VSVTVPGPPFSAEIERELDSLLAGVDLGDPRLLAAMRRELGERLGEERPLRVYLGLDPTSPNVHLGHAVVLDLLARFQRRGDRITLVIGDFTASIGDPSGRSKTRPPLTREEIEAHAATYAEQAFKVLDEFRTETRYNSEWLAPLRLDDVVRLSASMTLAQVLVREDFRTRHEQGTPIHLHEFLYALMQGHDACVLEADVQVGGTDQLFNLMTGRDVMRHRGLPAQVCLTMPILPGTDGTLKMSKSHGNDIGLTLEPADMYGKVMSIPDSVMPDFFRLASGLDPAEAEQRVAALAEGGLHPRDAKAELARRIVARWHDEAAAAAAEEAFVRQFREHELPEELPDLPVPEAAATVLDLVAAVPGVKSRGEARRLIQQGGVSLDGETVGSWDAPLPAVADGRVLRVGKRRIFRVVGAR
jgi:tyrosyl-tRNA synthetase